MWPATAELLAAIDRNHQMTTTVTVLRGGETLGDVPIRDGAVDASLVAADGRSATLTVDSRVTDAGILDPLSDLVIVRTGVPGVEMVPLFTGRVDTVDDDTTGNVKVSCVSRAVEMGRDRFDTPFAAIPDRSVAQEIARIAQRTDPSWAVDISRAPTEPVPPLVWEDDPARAADELASAINCVLMPDRTGGFALIPSAFAPTANITFAATLRDGDNGCLVAMAGTRTRKNIWNSVTVVVERTDGTAPIRVTVRDDMPTSPTYWGGPFGKQSTVIKTDAPVSETEALVQARRILRQSLAATRSWRISIPHNPTLDPGDVVAVWRGDNLTVHLVESVGYPLLATAPTTLATRELRRVQLAT